MTAPQVAEAVFDSHRFVKRLTEAGMERGLAEVLAEEHMGPWIRNVATKTDVESFRREAAAPRLTRAGRGPGRRMGPWIRNVATKTDVESFRREAATKADMELVRRDLADTEANIRRDVATKADMELIRRDLADTEANIRRDVATKTDMEAVREDLANFRTEAASKKNLATLRADMVSKKDLEHAVKVARLGLEKRIAELRGDLIKWMFGALMAQGALVVAIIKLFS